jgi:hypothetical protein
MTDEKIRRPPLISQLLLILMGAMLVFLVVSFAGQVTISHQQSAKLNRVEDKIRIAVAEKAQLDKYLAYVWSLEAVERWARQHGWTKPNERLVVPVGVGTEGPPPEQEILEEARKPDSPQGEWWDLFFRIR